MKLRKLKTMSKRKEPIDFKNPKDIEFLFREVTKVIYNSGIVMEIDNQRHKDVVHDLADLDKRLEKIEGRKK